MSDELERRLRDSAPAVRCEAYTTTLGPLLDEVTSGGRRPRRWTRQGVGVALAALVFVPSGAVAAGVHFAAETGEYGQRETTETDTSQYIDLCAPDIREYLLARTPELPLPAGVSWRVLADEALAGLQVSCPPRDYGLTTQERGIANLLLRPAACEWAAAFVRADRAGSEVGRSEAARGLHRVEEAILASGKDSSARQRRDEAAREDAAAISRQHDLCTGSPVADAPADQPA